MRGGAECSAQRAPTAGGARSRSRWTSRARRKAAAYLGGFFADIADDRKIAAKVLKTCLLAD